MQRCSPCWPLSVPCLRSTVKLLWDNRDELGIASSATLRDLGLSDGACLVVSAHTPAIVAFDHMAVDHKSSVGIVDDNGELIGNLSVRARFGFEGNVMRAPGRVCCCREVASEGSFQVSCWF